MTTPRKELLSKPIRPTEEPAHKAKPTAKGKRPPVPLPADSDELMALSRDEVERLYQDLILQRVKLQKRRIEHLENSEIEALSAVNGMLKSSGLLIHLLHERRGYMRRVHGREVGVEPYLEKAFYVASSSELPQKRYDKLMQRAAALMRSWLEDLPSEDEIKKRVALAIKDATDKRMKILNQQDGLSHEA